MLVAKQIQTNTIDTKYEYDGDGKVVHKVVTETLELPDVPSAVTCSCACDCDDDYGEGTLIEHELELPVTPLDIIMGAAGIASIIASGCMIAKALRK